MTNRSGFSSRLGFIAAAAGSAVGLGNIWRFPYEAGQNGGAAFLIIYLLCIFIIGFPVLLGEVAVGRRTQANPFGAYKQLGGKSWAWVGFFGVLCGVMILSFYNVVAGWSFGYFVQIVFGGLLENTPADGFGAFLGSYISDTGNVLIYSIVFMALTAFILARGVEKGIEAASKILMPALFLILIGLILYAITLPGAGKGISYYLVPKMDLINLETVYSAMGQAFFSLSLGMGALITYGSYLSKKENLVSSVGIVTIADTSVAFLAGLLIFPLVFSQGLEPSAGPGLVFAVLPGIFQGMGLVAGKIVGGAFFLLLCVAALTSTISLLEVPVAYLVDERKWPRTPVVIGMATLIFLVGLPSMLSQGASETFSGFIQYYTENADGVLALSDVSFLDFVNDIFGSLGLVFGGCMLSIFIGYKWKTENLSKEIFEGNESYAGSALEKTVNILITYVCPLVLGITFILTVLQKFFGVSVF